MEGPPLAGQASYELEPWTQSVVRFQMLASEISEVNIVNPENCYELAHNRYLKRSINVYKKTSTIYRWC